MQEEIEHRRSTLPSRPQNLSARTLLRGMQFLLRQYDKHASQGKQSMKRLVRQEPWRDQCGDPENWHQGLLTAMLSGITSTTPSRKTCPARRPDIWSTSRHRTRMP